MKRTLLIATTMLALAACASQPPQTLDQKLAEAPVQPCPAPILQSSFKFV